jgi:hypothetical protein
MEDSYSKYKYKFSFSYDAKNIGCGSIDATILSCLMEDLGNQSSMV